MELNRLNYFYQVALCGSFTKAADLMHVSQPSISKMVASLEEGLGEQLFLRRKGGIRLTPAGEIVFEKCGKIFTEIKGIRLSLSESHEEITGDLNIGASDNLCNYVLPSVIEDISREFPMVKIKLFSGTSKDIQSELSAERVELGLFYAQDWLKAGYEAKALCFVEFFIVNKTELKLKNLEKIPFIGSRKDDYKKPYPALSMLLELGIKPNSIFETNSQETQKRMAMRGVGFTVVPKHMVEAELREGSLFRVSTAKKIGLPVQIATKRSRALSKAATIFEKQLTGIIDVFAR